MGNWGRCDNCDRPKDEHVPIAGFPILCPTSVFSAGESLGAEGPVTNNVEAETELSCAVGYCVSCGLIDSVLTSSPLRCPTCNSTCVRTFEDA